MNIEFHPGFKKSYRKRIASRPKLVNKTKERIELFRHNPRHPLLKDHVLIAKHQAKRAFSITGDIRVVYTLLDGKTVLFLDIGSHNQVY